MHRYFAALLALMALTAPLSARAQALSPADVFSAFQRICLVTEGDRALALQAMAASDWIVAPSNILPQLPPGLSDVDTRMGSTPDAMLFGFVAESARPQDEEAMPVCAVAIMPGVTGLDEQVAAWAGGEPAAVEAGTQLYVLRTDRGIHEAVTEADLPDAEAEALARAGHMFMVVVRTDERGTMLMRANLPR